MRNPSKSKLEQQIFEALRARQAAIRVVRPVKRGDYIVKDELRPQARKKPKA